MRRGRAVSGCRRGAVRGAGTAAQVHQIAGLDVGVHGDLQGFALDWTTRRVADGVEIATITLRRADAAPPRSFSLKWRIPSHDVTGNWATGRGLNKTIRPDWAGSRLQTSMFAQQAPVMTLFGSDGSNVLTFALSDALNTSDGPGVREEDGWSYNEVNFFTEPHTQLPTYTAELRIDRRRIPYCTALDDVSRWWATLPGYTPAVGAGGLEDPGVLDLVQLPPERRRGRAARELALAKPMGIGVIIVDDGWQTLDTSAATPSPATGSPSACPT